MNPPATRRLQVNGHSLGKHRHICAFFHSKEEERRTLANFIQQGFAEGDKALHCVAEDDRDEHRAWLSELGVDVPAAEEGGQLKLVTWEASYLQEDCFDQYRQLKAIDHELTAAHEEGFRQTRVVANMEWALEDKAGVDDIVEYTSRLNAVLSHHADPVIGTYNLSRFNAGVAMDILRAHPSVLLGGVLLLNPLHVPPEELLAELRDRRMEMAQP